MTRESGIGGLLWAWFECSARVYDLAATKNSSVGPPHSLAVPSKRDRLSRASFRVKAKQ